MPDVLFNLYPCNHSETKAVMHWNCYWRKAFTQMFKAAVIRAHPYIGLCYGKTKRQYRSWHSALSVTSIYRFVGSFEDISSPLNTNSQYLLDCPTNSANIAHIIKTHFVVKFKTKLPFFILNVHEKCMTGHWKVLRLNCFGCWTGLFDNCTHSWCFHPTIFVLKYTATQAASR